MADVQHNALDTTDLHKFAYVASSDPGAVGAGIGWVDTSAGTGAFVLKVRNAADTAWEDLGSSGGGVSDLASLTDVDLTGLADGDMLVWDNGAGMWVPTAPGGAGSVALDDLTDVDTTSTPPTTGDVLTFNGTEWEPTAPAGGGGGSSIGIFSPDVPYASPSAVDDEFDGGSLDPKWATDVTACTLNFDIPSQLGIVSDASGGIAGIKQTVAHADATWRMKVILGRGNSGIIGFSVKASGGTHYRTTYEYSTNAGSFSWGEWIISSGGVYTSHSGIETLPSNGIDVAALYLELQYVASTHTVIFRYSTDGINFKTIATTNTISSTDIAWIGILANQSSGQPHRIEWFRQLQGNYTGGMI
jgi:hypothetical protein